MISLHEPRFTTEDENLVLETLRSTWVSTGGPFVEQFEHDFAAYTGSRHAISVSNGTIALQLAIEVLKRQKQVLGHFDVIVPTLSFIATANSVFHSGGNPVLVDCSPQSMNFDPVAVDALIQEYYFMNSNGRWIQRHSGNELLCIMPAHIMGWSCNTQALQDIAQKHQIPVIDDAAEALGARDHEGTHLGKKSLAATFSFNGNKIITTGGGGMLVTDDDAFAKLAKHLSTTAKTDGLRYVHDQVGYNFRMVNILAALGVSQLKRMENTLAAKSEIAANYKKSLTHSKVRVHQETHNQPNHWIVNVTFETEALREKALHALIGKNIQARPLWTPAHRLPFITNQNTFDRNFPNADDIWRRALSLPSSAHLTATEVKTVVSTIEEAL